MNIILVGAGTQLSYSIDIIEKQGEHNIVGILDSLKNVGDEYFGFKIIGRQEDIVNLHQQYKFDGCVITIGDNWSRKFIYDQIAKLSPILQWPNIIHPSVIISNYVKIGKGIIVMAGVIINSGSILGDFTNYYTNANVEHDCIIDDFASVSAGVVMGGKVIIGKYSAISLNATIFDRIVIGENSVIGAASLVTKNVPSNVLFYGNPGKVIKKRIEGEKFLK